MLLVATRRCHRPAVDRLGRQIVRAVPDHRGTRLRRTADRRRVPARSGTHAFPRHDRPRDPTAHARAAGDPRRFVVAGRPRRHGRRPRRPVHRGAGDGVVGRRRAGRVHRSRARRARRSRVRHRGARTRSAHAAPVRSGRSRSSGATGRSSLRRWYAETITEGVGARSTAPFPDDLRHGRIDTRARLARPDEPSTVAG